MRIMAPYNKTTDVWLGSKNLQKAPSLSFKSISTLNNQRRTLKTFVLQSEIRSASRSEREDEFPDQSGRETMEIQSQLVRLCSRVDGIFGSLSPFHCLNVADCHRINSSALWANTGMNTLQELNLSRCLKKGSNFFFSLNNLSVLDMGGLPVNDMALSSLQVLKKLQYLDLWQYQHKRFCTADRDSPGLNTLSDSTTKSQIFREVEFGAQPNQGRGFIPLINLTRAE
ncbi:hypothetical protein L6164_019357 [Bauhinia variegata]|uniref:Uncharacterized protein n=1 Tax=Bauhinia variegata TaxID=167791 RepID=A0ACB9MRN0_BAUVA|nr:hypothetical protein L6164_019357 [Bauhinia variegata]